MNWIPVEVRSTEHPRTAPSASVGYGRIELNKAACELVDDIGRYPFVELLLDADSNRSALRLLSSSTTKSISMRPKISGGKRTGGVSIASKAHMRELFGDEGVQRRTTHYAVTLDSQQSPLLVLNPIDE